MDLLDDFDLISEPPALEEYLGLRKDAGLSQKTAEQGAAALTGSWFFLPPSAPGKRGWPWPWAGLLAMGVGAFTLRT